MGFLESLVNVVVKTLGYIGVFVYIGGIIWVYIDSQKMRKRSEKKEGLHPGVWLVLCLFFWNFAVTFYWILRKPRNIWKSLGVIFLLWIIPISILALDSFFSMQRRALQTELRAMVDSDINIGMSKKEIQYCFSAMEEIPLPGDSILFGIGVKEPVRAYYLAYRAGNDIIVLTFDAKVDTLIYIKWWSDLESEYGNEGEVE